MDRCAGRNRALAVICGDHGHGIFQYGILVLGCITLALTAAGILDSVVAELMVRVQLLVTNNASEN